MDLVSCTHNNNDIYEQIAAISKEASSSLSKSDKILHASYFTPKMLSDHMVKIADYRGGKLGDKGAGGGILSATAAARHILSKSNRPCFISANEIIPQLRDFLKQSYKVVSDKAHSLNKAFDEEINGDFTDLADKALATEFGDYENIIINPPYFKISPKNELNQIIKQHLGFTVPNIYSGFMLISLHLLKQDGSLTALVPRSFFNGSYHKSFRRYIRQHYSIDTITRYRSRSNAFKYENVIQENVIVKFTKRSQVPKIKVFTCLDPYSAPEHEMNLASELLLNNDNDIFALPADLDELNAYTKTKSLPFKLQELGLKLSTGKVVEYRHKESLNNSNIGAMYIEAKCLNTDHDTYQRKHSKRSHGNALEVNEQTANTLIDAQNVILLKRISSNSDKQRMKCTVLRKSDCTSNKLALSNHIQYISGEALQDTDLALKIAKYLSSNDVEKSIRAISGTTQVNASDIDLIRFPSFNQSESTSELRY